MSSPHDARYGPVIAGSMAGRIRALLLVLAILIVALVLLVLLG